MYFNKVFRFWCPEKHQVLETPGSLQFLLEFLLKCLCGSMIPPYVKFLCFWLLIMPILLMSFLNSILPWLVLPLPLRLSLQAFFSTPSWFDLPLLSFPLYTYSLSLLHIWDFSYQSMAGTLKSVSLTPFHFPAVSGILLFNNSITYTIVQAGNLGHW